MLKLKNRLLSQFRAGHRGSGGRTFLLYTFVVGMALGGSSQCSETSVYNPGDPTSAEYYATLLLRCGVQDSDVCPAAASDPGTLFARVESTTNQSFTDSTSTAIAMDSHVLDVGGFFNSGASGTATIPWTGTYISILGATFASNAVGEREFSISSGGSSLVTDIRSATTGPNIAAATPMSISSRTAGDTVSITATQSSGAALNLTGGDFSSFQIARLAGAVSGSAAASITTPINMAASTPTILTWQTEVFDTSGFYSAGSATRLTAAQDGTYLILSRTSFATSVFGDRTAEILLNGSTVIAQEAYRPGSGDEAPAFISAIRQMSAGDYLEMRVTHTSAGNLNMQAGEFQLIRLDTSDTTFADRPLAIREMSADQSIVTASDTIISLDNTVSADSIFDVSDPTRTTFSEAGLYLVLMSGAYDSGSGNGRRRISLKKNGSSVYVDIKKPETTLVTTPRIAIALQMSASDYLEFQTNQSSGGNVNFRKSDARMTIMKLD